MDTYIDFNDIQLKRIIHKNNFSWLSKRCKFLGIIPKKSKIVDLGCGHGQNTLALSQHFDKAYGVDPSIKMLTQARKIRKKAEKWYNLSNTRFYLGDFQNIPLKQIDLFYLSNSIHFSKNIKEDLLNILSLVRIKGLIIISEPHNKSIFNDSIMNNKKRLKKKLKHIEIKRNEIKTFLKWCVTHKIASIIVQKEIENKYFVIIQKL